MKKLLALMVGSALFLSCNDKAAESGTADTKPASETTSTPKDAEIGDAKYVEMAKSNVANLSTGDIDSYMTGFADDAVYRWNNFDSIIGKTAITDYWKKRRTDVIDTMWFSNDIWLPIKVNSPLGPGQLTGNYALCWQITDAKYKTGKSMKQRVHTIYHFNANDKIDRVYQYLDRAPIMAAMTK